MTNTSGNTPIRHTPTHSTGSKGANKQEILGEKINTVAAYLKNADATNVAPEINDILNPYRAILDLKQDPLSRDPAFNGCEILTTHMLKILKDLKNTPVKDTVLTHLKFLNRHTGKWVSNNGTVKASLKSKLITPNNAPLLQFLETQIYESITQQKVAQAHKQAQQRQIPLD